jgi:hypothetical protein
MKVCTTCNKEKEISEFYKAKKEKFGVRGECKDCMKFYREKNREKNKLYRKENAIKIKQINDIWRKTHPEKIKDYGKKYYKEHPNYTKEYNTLNRERIKNRGLKKYGITLAQYNQLLKEQNGVCAICKQPETIYDIRTNKLRALAVDHNHITGKTRGLLCSHCNHGVGHFKEDIGILYNTIDYLNTHKD